MKWYFTCLPSIEPSGSIVVKDLDSLLWPSRGSFCRSASNTNDERLMSIDGLLNQGSTDDFLELIFYALSVSVQPCPHRWWCTTVFINQMKVFDLFLVWLLTDMTVVFLFDSKSKSDYFLNRYHPGLNVASISDDQRPGIFSVLRLNLGRPPSQEPS